jgi:hypothetical protein
MWEGMSLFDPSWDDFIKAANGSDASLSLGEGEEMLWLGKASGKYASISYYPRQMWSVFGILTISLVVLARIASTAPNIGERIIYVYLILLLFFAIVSVAVYVYAYRYWLYIGRYDLYIITSKRIIFFISAGRWIFPWGGVLSDTILRRNAVAHNNSGVFSIAIRKLNAVEVRKLPRVDVGNIYFPGWADDRRLKSADYNCFLCDESAAAPSASILTNRTMFRIGPRHSFRPSGMYSVPQITRVGQLAASLIRKAKGDV